MDKKQFHDFLSKELNRKPQEGGFFPLDILKGSDKKKWEEKCNSFEHDPPKYLHIPQGQGYKHVCPVCGKAQYVIPPQISF